MPSRWKCEKDRNEVVGCGVVLIISQDREVVRHDEQSMKKCLGVRGTRFGASTRAPKTTLHFLTRLRIRHTGAALLMNIE
jgi:hypothetical protein